MKYYLYHIPGKKIGVTSNLKSRVTEQQGYKEGEYEVLMASDNIDFISTMEVELQAKYNYKVDRQLYKNVINNNNMKINVTEATTTFPVPANKLKGNLMDMIGLKWDTHLGEFELTVDKIPWILKNITVSMFNNSRCYIYNKAFYEEFINNPEPFKQAETLEMFDNIRSWASERGLYDKGDAKTQYLKLQEEAGELARALLKDDQVEVVDAIGDMVVVLTNLAHLRNLTIESCTKSAYNVIMNRTGSMVNGTFVKDNK